MAGIVDATKDEWAEKADDNGGAYYWQGSGGSDPWHHVVMRQGDTKMSFISVGKGTKVKEAASNFANAKSSTRIVISGMFQDAGGLSNDLMGDVVVNHQKISTYSPTPYRAYVSFDASHLQQGVYSMGLGFPPNDADTAFSGVCPLILGGKKFDTTNGFYKGLNQKPFGTGKAIIALCAKSYIVYVAVQPDGSSNGMTVDATRDYLAAAGFDDAVLLDGSDSVMLYRNRNFLVSPGSMKNRINKSAIAFHA